MNLKTRHFLDWNAGAPLLPEARAAMLAALSLEGNASSVHAEGRAARARIEAARQAVAALVGGDPRALTFTSGGTEANVTVLAPGVTDASGVPCDTLVISAVEHPSVMAGGRFPPEAVRIVPVDRDGVVDPDALAAVLAAAGARGGRALVSVMAANNETGVLQPVAEVARIAHAAGALVHTDAVQAAGRVPLDIAALGVDVLTMSAHKLGGPRGAGAILRASEAIRIPPLLTGGGQEGRLRAGTEDVAAIAGFAAACEVAAARLDAWAATATLRDMMEARLQAANPDLVVFGAGAPRLANTSAFALPGVPAETALIALDLEGFAVSSGAACSSGKVTRSHVLAAMGADEALAAGALRVSLGPTTSATDLDAFCDALTAVVARIRATVAPRHAA